LPEAYFARQEGFRTFFTLRHKLEMGQLPAEEIFDGAIILGAGLLLITPGILTDVAGFVLLVRPIRNRIKTEIRNRFTAHFHVGVQSDVWEDYE